MNARVLLAAVVGVVLVGAGCSGSEPMAGTAPTMTDIAVETQDNSAYTVEMAEVEMAWDGFTTSAVNQDYDTFQSYIDVELSDAEIASGMGRFVLSAPEIDWTKSIFENEVRVAVVSTKGAELGTWSKNTDGTWSMEQRYWKMSNE